MKTTLIYILLVGGWLHVYAQQFPLLKFSHITTKEGLSNNTVNAIAQDRDGFIWIGTNDGLNRLDGYRVKTFFHQPKDSNTLVNNFITGIAADNSNNVWVATVEGMSCLKKYEGRFKNFIHERNCPAPQSTNLFRAIYFDSSANQVCSSVSNSLIVFNNNFQYKEFPINKSTLAATANSSVVHYYKMYEDIEHNLWALFENKILKLDQKNKSVVQAFSTNGADIQCIVEDSKYNYWLGTFGQGVIFFNSKSGTFTKIPIAGNILFIYDIKQWKDRNNKTWLVIGTGNGLILMDPITHQSKVFKYSNTDNFCITGGNINYLFVDNKGILWIGTERGVSYVDPSMQLIESWSIDASNEKNNSLQDDFAFSFLEDGKNYWAGRWARPGLLLYDTSGKAINYLQTPIVTKNDSKGITSNIYSIAKIDNDKLLLSTESGITEFSITQHKLLFETTVNEIDPGFRKIERYDDSTWWIRTRNNGPNGIFVYNSISHKITGHYHYTKNCAKCLPPNLYDFIITKNKNIYTSPANNYLYVFDKKQNNFVPFFAATEQTQHLPSSNFHSLAEDANGNIWVGTSNGLIELDPTSKKIINDFSTDKAIGGLEIDNLCFDDEHNLWMNSERGLFCYDDNTKQFFNFNTGDGLPDNSMPGFLYKGKNGYMYAGDLGFIIRFRPDELLRHHVSLKARISEAAVMNTLSPFQLNNKNEKTISLKPWEDIFSVDFSILNFDNAESNLYYYKLDGVMQDWKKSDNGHLSFYNLPPGEYKLHVAGGNKYGERFKDEDFLLIEVKPYWWQTKWLYVSSLLIAVVIVYFLVRKRIENIRYKSSLKTKIAETEMMALRAQMNPHFIFNCMNIIDGLITSDRKEEAQDFLQKFSKLIRLVLENSQHPQVPLQQDLQALQLYIELEAIRFNHHFKYEFDIDEDMLEDNFKIPPLLFQPYVENAIVHGLRNKENGEGKLVLRIKKEKGYVLAEVEDNGIGRKRSAILNEENKKPYQHLGMKVTAKRIDLLRQINNNQVEISITDMNNNEETGTKVSIILPGDLRFE